MMIDEKRDESRTHLTATSLCRLHSEILITNKKTSRQNWTSALYSAE